MEAHASAERPYRSHLQPACVPCRRRKSRCQTEANSSACLMCKLHKSNCHYPDSPQKGSTDRPDGQRSSTHRSSRSRSRATAKPPRATAARRSSRRVNIGSTDATPSQTVTPLQGGISVRPSEELPGLDAADDENLHIVGPAATDDSRVLTDYLAGVPGAQRRIRMVLPASLSRSKPVLFTAIQKRPLGIAPHQSPAAEKLEIIEKLLEFRLDDIIEMYFRRINPCMPLLEEDSFRRQLRDDKKKISPALLASIYAHMVVYCAHSPESAGQPWPDGRFIWNLANEALYSELHLSPGVPIITAILLNVGGRPTTSLIGNGVLLASALSVAHSLGLNHDPTDWNIPESEKRLRKSIWWALYVQDKWTSLAHGTPPRIARSQHDVPHPTRQQLCPPGLAQEDTWAASIFAALVGLTGVLDTCLENMYNIEQRQSRSTLQIELALHTWVDSLVGIPRVIILRGTSLDLPGASNLRLAYLSMRLLVQRTQLEAMKQDAGSSEEQLLNSSLQGRQLAEEILFFTRDLQPTQLNDFWLPVAAFMYPSTVNFLLRHALETTCSVTGLAQTSSFQLARQLIDILRVHKETRGWDMGDVCLAQHAEIIDKVLANVVHERHGAEEMLDLHDFVMPDALILEDFFPSLWDPLQNA